MGEWGDGERTNVVFPLFPFSPAKCSLVDKLLMGAALVANVCISIACRKLAIAAIATQIEDKRILFNSFSTSTHRILCLLSFVLCPLKNDK